MWDFVIEVMQTPGLRGMAAIAIALLAALVLAVLMMAYSGLMDLRLSYGGFEVALG